MNVNENMIFERVNRLASHVYEMLDYNSVTLICHDYDKDYRLRYYSGLLSLEYKPFHPLKRIQSVNTL